MTSSVLSAITEAHEAFTLSDGRLIPVTDATRRSGEVIAFPRGGVFPDVFAVTTRSISTTNFQVNIMRLDSATGWGQQLQLDWMAWT